MTEQRVKTGIPGFDTLIEGGLPGGSMVLVTGAPGTGKSIFCLQSLVNGCEQGYNGLFVSFEQPEEDVLAQARRFGWPVDEYIQSGKLAIKSIDLLSNVDVLGEIDKLISEKKVSHIAIDSLTALQNHPNVLRNVQAMQQIQTFDSKEEMWSLFGQETRMRLLIHYLIRRMKKTGCLMTLLISDTDEDSPRLSKDGISEFLADGVILLYYWAIGAVEERALKIKKMRCTSHEKDAIMYDIGKTGIEIKREER